MREFKVVNKEENCSYHFKCKPEEIDLYRIVSENPNKLAFQIEVKNENVLFYHTTELQRLADKWMYKGDKDIKGLSFYTITKIRKEEPEGWSAAFIGSIISNRVLRIIYFLNHIKEEEKPKVNVKVRPIG